MRYVRMHASFFVLFYLERLRRERGAAAPSCQHGRCSTESMQYDVIKLECAQLAVNTGGGALGQFLIKVVAL